MKGSKELLKLAKFLDWHFIIITNQSGIGRGYYSEKDFETLTKWMLKELIKNKIKISKVCFCPHTDDDNCNCALPGPVMIIVTVLFRAL